MAEQEYIFDPYNKVDVQYGYYVLFGSLFGFGLLSILVTKVGKPTIVKGDAWRWNNILISWIHGLISGIWCLVVAWLYPEMMSNLIYFINYPTYLLVAFSTGYFAYDFLDLVFRRRVLSNWEVALHHVAVGSMFWYNFHNKMVIPFNCLAISVEVNSIFLHARKLMHMLQYKFDNPFYRLVCGLNLLTFAVFRGFSLTRIAIALATEYDQVPWLYHKFLFASMFITNAINIVLFWRLFKNDVLRNIKGKESGRTKASFQTNNNDVMVNGDEKSH